MPLAVVVRDAHGQVIDNLTRDDFEVLDRGVPQTLASFSVERRSAAGSGGRGATPGGPAAPIGPRSVAFYFDDLDSSFEFGNVQHARQAALDFLNAGLGPGEQAGIFTASGRQEVPFTTDAAALEKAVAAIEPVRLIAPPCPLRFWRPVESPPRWPRFEIPYDYLAYLAEVENDSSAAWWVAFLCADENLRLMGGDPLDTGRQISQGYWKEIEAQSRGVFASIDRALALLGAQPGERVLVLSGSGFITETFREERAKLEEDALRGGITVNVLDSDGVPVGSARAPVPQELGGLGERSIRTALMTDITAATGGTFYRDPRDLGPGMWKLASAPPAVYLMSYVPKPSVADGRFHPIKVRLRSHPAAEIQTRDGYSAPPREENPSATELRQILNEAAMADTETAELPATLATRVGARTGQAPATLHLSIAVDARKLDWANVADRSTQVLTFAAVLFRANGRYSDGEKSTMVLRLLKTTRDRLEKTGIVGEMNLPAAAGTYRLRVVVMESVHGRISTFTRTVVVP